MLEVLTKSVQISHHAVNPREFILRRDIRRVQESVGVKQESFGVAPIFRFSRRFTTKRNPYDSFRTRLGLTISSIAFVLSILASLIFSHTTNEQVKLYVRQLLAELRQKTDLAFTTVWQLQQEILNWNIKQVKIPTLLRKDEIASLSKFLSQIISHLTQQENELKASNTHLQLELTARLTALEMLHQQAEETRLALEKERQMSEIKSQFIAIASHEFRTPLTSILLSCEFLKNHHHKLSEETKQRHFGQIKSSVKQLDQVIEDVLLAGRVQAGKLQFKPAPLALVNFCWELVEQLQMSAGERYNLHFVSHCSYNATTKNLPLMDEKLLRHILTNLLSNAIKYSPQGGDIEFALICDLEKVIFRIQDEGIGIPKEEQAQLFTSFFRCSNTGNLPGTGLGLTIVKNAVELHGGQITVESEVDEGTTFTVILPLNHTVIDEKIPDKNGVSRSA